MALDIDVAFVKQFESEVHMAYQRMGSKLRGTVRQKNNIRGKDTTFQKVGKGEAAQKSRHGNVPVMSIEHTNVLCTLQDWYAADYIDKLDELKINHDERAVVTNSAAYAMGRKTDSLIIDALNGVTTQVITESGTTGLNTTKIDTVERVFAEKDVPDDGNRYFIVSPQAWLNLLADATFSDADYVGMDDLPYKGGMVARRWRSFMWFVHSGLPKTTTKRELFAYHVSAVGHASGADVSTEMNYIPEKVAHLATSYMSQGAVAIDETGIYKVQINEA
jgi:hypothetical protein